MKNEIFEAMEAKLRSYEVACSEFEDTKRANKASMDEDEFWAWYKENDKPEYPLSGGQNKAFRMWYWNESDELNMDDNLWESEVHDFIETLRSAEVETFTYTNQSTGLMENMHWFAKEGCKLLGLCEVESADRWDKGQMKMAVRFAL